MKFNIKKSAEILVKNPNIMLLLVGYLLIMVSVLPILVSSYGKPVYYIFYVLLFLFTCAFLSGWFGIIKAIVEYKETNIPENDLKHSIETFKNDFFASIPVYMPPLIVYFLILIGFREALVYLADFLTGKPDDIINGIRALQNDQDSIVNFISTLPKDAITAIIQRSILLYTGSIVYLLFTLYSVPALYFGKSKNPFLGLKNGFLAFIKKFAGSFILFCGLAICHILIIFFEAIGVVNPGLMFIALILRVSFLTFMVVLIFSVYEANFTADCNNGSHGLREN